MYFAGPIDQRSWKTGLGGGPKSIFVSPNLRHLRYCNWLLHVLMLGQNQAFWHRVLRKILKKSRAIKFSSLPMRKANLSKHILCEMRCKRPSACTSAMSTLSTEKGTRSPYCIPRTLSSPVPGFLLVQKREKHFCRSRLQLQIVTCFGSFQANELLSSLRMLYSRDSFAMR